jgi:hypothetical protein
VCRVETYLLYPKLWAGAAGKSSGICERSFQSHLSANATPGIPNLFQIVSRHHRARPTTPCIHLPSLKLRCFPGPYQTLLTTLKVNVKFFPEPLTPLLPAKGGKHRRHHEIPVFALAGSGTRPNVLELKTMKKVEPTNPSCAEESDVWRQ